MTAAVSFPWSADDYARNERAKRRPEGPTTTQRTLFHAITPTASTRDDRIYFATDEPLARNDRKVYQDYPYDFRPIRSTTPRTSYGTLGYREGEPSPVKVQGASRRVDVPTEDTNHCGEYSSSPCGATPTPVAQMSQKSRPPITRPTTTVRRPVYPNNHTAIPSHSTAKAIKDMVVFPDARRTFVPKKAFCRASTTFCEDRDNDYPAEYIKKLLENSIGYDGIFGEDVVTDMGINHRLDVSDDVSLCPSEEKLVYPTKGQIKSNDWRFIVQQDKHLQGVRVEQCMNTGPCPHLEGFPYKTACRQKYIYRKLLGVNEKGDAVTDSFKLPSCCSCVIIQDTAARIAFIAPERMTPAVKSLKPSKSSE